MESIVKVIIDRPLRSRCPKDSDIIYGYMEEIMAPDDCDFNKEKIAKQIHFQEQY